MISAVLLIFQISLPHYSVTVDPDQLEYLYQHFHDELEIPATVCCDTSLFGCTIAFRGGASLYLEKKSWHITLDKGASFSFGDHLLLNAQYLDPSMMRNTLGHLLTRELGYPAPETEFVTLSINGENMGVYERVERIDRLFFQRNGFDFGPLFKSICPLGRLVCHYSDRSGTYSFEPKADSEPYRDQLLALIEDCFRGDVSSLATEEFIALFAVKTATANRDAVIKNFYLHLWDDRWHIYPWDCDASLGNSPGEYIPGWTTKYNLDDISCFGATRALLESQDNVVLFNSMLEASAEIMANRYPEIIDSIRMEIRTDLSQDPYVNCTSARFDSICAVLSSDVAERAEFLSQVYLADPSPEIVSYEVSPCLELETPLEVSVELQGGDPDGVVFLISVDGADEEAFVIPEQQEDTYSFTWDVPPGTYSVRIAFGPRIKPCIFPVFYPSWSFKDCEERPVPAPGARVSLAPLYPHQLQPDSPVWCGENLWVLPVTSTSDVNMDLSLCCFTIGYPSGTIFFPESVLVEPGETFHLTNNSSLADNFYSGKIYGDAGNPFPSGTQLVLNDPSWHEMMHWGILDGDSLPSDTRGIVPCEICRGCQEDWIELYNSGDSPEDLSGWYFTDSNSNTSIVPEKTILDPGEIILFREESLQGMEGGTCQTHPLEFALDRESDVLSLFSNLGHKEFSVSWNDDWPVSDIIYLRYPVSPFSSPHSWLSAQPPGTPGEPNPGWEGLFYSTSLQLLSENPSSGAFSIAYQCSTEPLEALLFSITGRMIARLALQGTLSGTVNADFSGRLPSGVYIVYLRSSTGSDSVRLTVLTEE